MNERGSHMQEYIEGRFGRMEGEEITDDKLKAANKRKRAIKSGRGDGGEAGVFEGDDTENEQEDEPV